MIEKETDEFDDVYAHNRKHTRHFRDQLIGVQIRNLVVASILPGCPEKKTDGFLRVPLSIGTMLGFRYHLRIHYRLFGTCALRM